jgi:hypothetical protein
VADNFFAEFAPAPAPAPADSGAAPAPAPAPPAAAAPSDNFFAEYDTPELKAAREQAQGPHGFTANLPAFDPMSDPLIRAGRYIKSGEAGRDIALAVRGGTAGIEARQKLVHGAERAGETVKAVSEFSKPWVAAPVLGRELYEKGREFVHDPGRTVANVAGSFYNEPLTNLALMFTGGAPKGAELAAKEAAELAAKRGVETAGKEAVETAGKEVAETAGKETSRQAAQRAARAEGLPVPASMRGDRPIAGAIESLTGKVKTAQAASQKSQPIIQKLAKREMGLTADAELTPAAYEGVRKTAYEEGYAPLKRLGTPFKTDEKYEQAIKDLQGSGARTAEKYSELLEDPEISKLQKTLPRGEIDPEDAVNLIQRLRERATGVLRHPMASSAEKDLARARMRAANAIEGVVERGLKDKELLRNFHQARTRIGKSFDWERATNAAGEVDAKKMAAQNFKKKNIMTGESKTVADYGAHFEKSAQLPSKIAGEHTFGPMDILLGLKEPATMFARPLTRAAMLSETGQRALDIGAGALARRGGQYAMETAPGLARRTAVRGAIKHELHERFKETKRDE